ncbi:C-5 sterol desaturase [Mycolicibacterium litorale]|nr:C-5 sterol desaturase [Mycolicibacterium litorale]
MDQILDQAKLVFVYAIPAFLLLMAVEYYGYRREKRESSGEQPQRRATKGVSARDTACNVSTYLIRLVVGPLEKFIELPFVVIAAAFAPVTLPANQWWTWGLALLLADLAYYVKHRMSHRIRMFWAEHSVHHSSQYFNLSTALRLPWLIPGSFLKSVVSIPMALIGIPVWVIFLCQAIVLLYQFPIHTERIDKLPKAIEYVFNTPSHHRVHHGANNPYLDKNYGGILIIWDRLFGSYADEVEAVRYGLTKNIQTDNPIKVNYHEFALMVRDVWRATSWRGRIGYLLRPPGWQETPAQPDPAPVPVTA